MDYFNENELVKTTKDGNIYITGYSINSNNIDPNLTIPGFYYKNNPIISYPKNIINQDIINDTFHDKLLNILNTNNCLTKKRKLSSFKKTKRIKKKK